jgi:endonuclease/exonuclease/phosphatase family metal-dependent hydrolase
MKIITLNIWGGKAGKEKVLSFFDSHKDVDIFCLQEVWSAPYPELQGMVVAEKLMFQEDVMTQAVQDISELFIDHMPLFRPHFGDHFGLLMFVKNNIEIIEEGEIFVYQEKGFIPEGDVGNHARNLQYVKVLKEGKTYTVFNVHGLWNGQGKGDSEDRIKQSEKIVSFIKSKDSENFVLCGDFNLSLDTKSIEIIEQELNARNLVKEHGITSTRTSYYKKENKFADYMFTGSNIVVKDFKVLPDEVSDHSPLYLEIE